MAVGIRGRPGKGSTKPANVKLRPIPQPEDRARPRKKGTGRNAVHDDGDTTDEEENDEDRVAREQYAEDGNNDDDDDEDIMKLDDKKPLEGMTVCVSGQLQCPKEAIGAMCQSLGAIFESVLTTETTFLVSDTTTTDKYKACVENGIPILESAFILELHRQWIDGNQVDLVGLSEALRLAPLRDLVICLTGYDENRELLRSHITNSGGAAYSPELTGEVTHLVIGPAHSSRGSLLHKDKYIWAKQINTKRMKHPKDHVRAPMQIVWGEWLEHSLVAFGRVREELYSVEAIPDRSSLAQQRFVRARDIVHRREEESPRKNRKQKQQQQQKQLNNGDQAQIRSKRKLLKQDTMPSIDANVSTSSDKGKKRAREESEDGSKKVKREVSNPSIAHEKAMTEVGQDNSHSREEEEDKLEPVYVKKGAAALSRQPVQNDDRERSSSLAPRPTMQKQRSSTQMELLGVQDLLVPKREEPSQAFEMSNIANTSLDASAGPSNAAGSLLSKMNNARSGKFVNKQTESASVRQESVASTSKLVPTFEVPDLDLHPQDSTMADELEEEEAEEEQEDAPPSLIFENKTFYLVPGEFAAALVPRIAEAISMRGGRVASSDGADVDYLLCKTLATTRLSVDETDPRLITGDWLEFCMVYDQVLEGSELVDALSKPIRCPLPLPNVAHLRVAHAGFDADVDQPKLLSILDRLGIKHDIKIRRTGENITTHLLIPDEGYKSDKNRLEIARQWGAQIVRPQWIRDLALQHSQTLMTSTQSSKTAVKREDASQSIAKRRDISSDSEAGPPAPLSGCTVHVARKVQDWRGLEKLVDQLGGRTLQQFDEHTASEATHYIFQSATAKPTNRDFLLAVNNKVKIVHPDWLHQTAAKGERQPEASYKHTRNSKRGLEVVIQSQGMSRGNSSTSTKSETQAPSSDDLNLPPPLSRSSNAPMPSMQGIKQSTPQIKRTQVGQVEGFSTAVLASTPDVSDQADVMDHLPEQQKVDDSGFIASAGKLKGGVATASEALNTSPYTSPARLQSKAKGLLMTASDPALHTETPASAPAVSSRNLMAEMEALLQADVTPQQLNVRLPYQQAGNQSRSIRRPPGLKKAESALAFSEIRGLTSSAGQVEGGLLLRRQAYSNYVETQYGNGQIETQDANDEQTMVIKINDPTAEATKARLLAGVRSAQSAEAVAEGAKDEEATEQSSGETTQRSTRSTRTAATRASMKSRS